MSEPLGSCFLFHPKGVRVTFPLTGVPTSFMRQIDDLLAQGWLVREPGLGEGENRDVAVKAVKTIINETFCIDLYREGDTFRYLGVYLNDERHEQAFEFASGLKVAAMPQYDGVGHIEIGKAANLDKYVVALPKKCEFVWKENPKHDPNSEEGKKKPKRLFIRWAEQMPAGAAAAGNDEAYAKWKEYIVGKPGPAAMTDSISDAKSIKDAQLRERVQLLIQDYCNEAGFKWDAAARCLKSAPLSKPSEMF